MNSQPSSVSTRSIVRVGGGAPATTIRVRPRPGISPCHCAAASSTAFTTAGAPLSNVTPCASTRRRISAPSTLRMTMWRPPMPVTAYGIPHPLQWNIGSVWRYTSRSLTPVCHPKTVALIQQLRWVSCTPLGRAVVELGVDKQHGGAGVVDDVADFVGVEPEVDGHEDPARSADPEEGHEQSSRVGRDDRDP